MKNLTKILTAFFLLVTMTGCTLGASGNNLDIKILQQSNNVMFTCNHDEYFIITNETQNDERLLSTKYTINYNGTIDMEKEYANAGVFNATARLSDEDYKMIYTLSENAVKQNNFGEYMLDGFEGGIYTIIYYDTDGVSTQLVSGAFGSGNYTLDKYRENLNSYSDAAEFLNANGETVPF